MESLHSVGATAAILRFYGGLGDKVKGETIPSGVFRIGILLLKNVVTMFSQMEI